MMLYVEHVLRYDLKFSQQKQILFRQAGLQINHEDVQYLSNVIPQNQVRPLERNALVLSV